MRAADRYSEGIANGQKGAGAFLPSSAKGGKTPPYDFPKLSLPQESAELGAPHHPDEPDIADGGTTGRARRTPQRQI